MHTQWIPFTDVPQLSYKDVAYTTEKPELRPFYQYAPNLASFKQVIRDKSRQEIDRATLVKVLREQYSEQILHEAVVKNINLLASERTFTVVTAHQPSLFTGPLYYIYKIISTINLSRQLTEQYPDYHFVPIFVTGGEDHDFEEVNYINLFGKKIEWHNDESGSVGMMSTDSLAPALEELQEILGQSERATAIFSILKNAYTRHDRYADATIDLVNQLFGEYGLVVLSMNHAELKRLFIPQMLEEIFEQPSQELVQKTTEQLEKINFSLQAYPREINFFYLRENLRERIVQEQDQFKVLNSQYVFSRAELEEEIKKYPERFSPNVVMRPLYQEVVLPNLAYIGGGGEISYWLERKQQFEHFGVNFPMLIRRNSVMWLDKGLYKKMVKVNLEVSSLFEDTDSLIRQFVESQSQNELTITPEITAVEKAYDDIADKGKQVDPTLVKAILAEKTRQIKSLEQLESRLLRAEKQKHDVAINQIRSLKEKLYPNLGLQERYDNFLGLYLKYGRAFFDYLLLHLDPLKKQFLVVSDDGDTPIEAYLEKQNAAAL